ncbi:hypothetical protein MUK42_09898 [Musa troglodytarum]|uniref:Trichome birefringence-like C-terminal domain-containing protein n=1 Tax=Musa troglodytarum TaxID=320322 RepID=A0A9E7EGZ5_9LILI|nr:hypothetical protein MUK42_09898 [Musa troglodytarum]
MLQGIIFSGRGRDTDRHGREGSISANARDDQAVDLQQPPLAEEPCLHPESLPHTFQASHLPWFISYQNNGTWDDGGSCTAFTEPEKDPAALGPEPWNNRVIADTVEGMKSGGRKVQLLNITYLTEFRKDAHPSAHREPGTPADAPEDCSHWCLPGVPDTWNQLLYAYLLMMDYDTRKNNV